MGDKRVWTCAALRVNGKSEIIRTKIIRNDHNHFPFSFAFRKIPQEMPIINFSEFRCSHPGDSEVCEARSVKSRFVKFTRWGLRIARLGVCAVRGSSWRVAPEQLACFRAFSYRGSCSRKWWALADFFLLCSSGCRCSVGRGLPYALRRVPLRASAYYPLPSNVISGLLDAPSTSRCNQLCGEGAQRQ